MARLLFFAALLPLAAAEAGHDHDDAFEWAGTFNVSDYEYVTWTAQQSDEGAYPDATMKIAILRGNADFSLEGAAPSSSETVEQVGGHAMDNTCADLANGADIPISAKRNPACYRLVFDSSVHTTIFAIDTTGVDSIAIFAEHFPIEFERDAHYLKGPDGSDIEPIDEHPTPPEPDKRWGAAIGASVTVMLCTLCGIIFLAPFFARLQKTREAVVTILTSAFAAGALVAAAFYLMLYEATHLIEITEERPESAAAAWWGSATLIGFIFPFILESLVATFMGTGAEAPAPAEADAENADAEKDKAGEAARVRVEPSRKVRVLGGVLLGDFFHNLVDGFFIGAAFTHCESSMGWTITLTTVYHELAQELSDYLVLTNPLQGGLSPFVALGLNFLTGTSVLLGVAIVMAAEPSNFVNGLLLAMGAGVYLQIAATECMPRVNEFATTLQRRLGGIGLFFIGALAIGLVLLDHEHCAGEGSAHAHGH